MLTCLLKFDILCLLAQIELAMLCCILFYPGQPCVIEQMIILIISQDRTCSKKKLFGLQKRRRKKQKMSYQLNLSHVRIAQNLQELWPTAALIIHLVQPVVLQYRSLQRVYRNRTMNGQSFKDNRILPTTYHKSDESDHSNLNS